MKKAALKVMNIDDLRALEPCADPVDHFGLDPEWKGTIIDILKMESLNAKDRVWVACQPGVISEKLQRLFAVWYARRILTDCKTPDPTIIACIEAAERFANGEGTAEEMEAARLKMNEAYWAADRAAYRAADWAAYWAADRAADRAAYWAADWAADWAAQVQYLIEMLAPLAVAGPCVPIARLEVAALVGAYALENKRRKLPFDYVGELFVLSDGRKIYREARGRRYGYTVSSPAPVVVA